MPKPPQLDQAIQDNEYRERVVPMFVNYSKDPEHSQKLKSIVEGCPALKEDIIYASHTQMLEYMTPHGAAVGGAASYQPAEKYISFPYTLLDNPNRATFILGHELGHIADRHINGDYSENTFTPELNRISRDSATPRNYTALIRDYIQDLRRDEAEANISGFNALASKLRHENQRLGDGIPSIEQMYLAAPDCMRDFMDVTGEFPNRKVTMKEGLTLSPDGSLSMNAQTPEGQKNIDMMKIYFSDKLPSALGVNGTLNYPHYYLTSLMTHVHDVEYELAIKSQPRPKITYSDIESDIESDAQQADDSNHDPDNDRDDEPGEQHDEDSGENPDQNPDEEQNAEHDENPREEQSEEPAREPDDQPQDESNQEPVSEQHDERDNEPGSQQDDASASERHEESADERDDESAHEQDDDSAQERAQEQAEESIKSRADYIIEFDRLGFTVNPALLNVPKSNAIPPLTEFDEAFPALYTANKTGTAVIEMQQRYVDDMLKQASVALKANPDLLTEAQKQSPIFDVLCAQTAYVATSNRMNSIGAVIKGGAQDQLFVCDRIATHDDAVQRAAFVPDEAGKTMAITYRQMIFECAAEPSLQRYQQTQQQTQTKDQSAQVL